MSINAAGFARWFQRKRYQYEVTFSLYMLTPTEKFIFNSFLFLAISMVLIGAALYLPQHLSFLSTRAWFYYHGEEPAISAAVDAAKAVHVDVMTALHTAAAVGLESARAASQEL